MLLSVMGFVNYSTMVALMTYIEIYGARKLYHGLQEKFLGILVVIVPIFTCFYLGVFLTDGPNYLPYLNL